MRTAIALVATSLIIAACADAPTPVAPKAPAAPVAPVSAAPAVTPSGSTVSPDLIK